MILNLEKIRKNILSYENYIKSFFEKNGKTISSRKTLSEEILDKEFGDEINIYNEKTEKFNKYIISKEQELKEIEKKKREEKRNLDTILDRIKKNLELLEDEKSMLTDINFDLNEYKNTLLNFDDRFKNSTKQIDNLIEQVHKYEEIFKNDVKEKIKKSKDEIEVFFEKEKEKITEFLKEKSKDIIEDKYNIENLKLTEEKRKAFRFDLGLFFKYLLLFTLVFGVSIIDFLLVKHIVVEEFDLPRNAEPSIKFLVHYIIPLIPSFILIFSEFIVRKNFRHLKKVKWTVHIFTLISIFFIIFSVFWTYTDGSFISIPNVNSYDLLSRILIFAIAIPVSIISLDKFFKWDDFVDFIKHLLLPITFIFLSLKYFFESFILKQRKNTLLKKSYIFKIDTSEIDLLQNKKHNLENIFNIPSTFYEDLNQISIKTEKAISNIQNIKNFLSKDQVIKKNSFSLINKKSNNTINILDGKIERLVNSIKYISKEIENQEENIDKRYEKEEKYIYENISKAKENRKIYKQDYDKNKENIKNIISEILGGINKENF